MKVKLAVTIRSDKEGEKGLKKFLDNIPSQSYEDALTRVVEESINEAKARVGQWEGLSKKPQQASYALTYNL